MICFFNCAVRHESWIRVQELSFKKCCNNTVRVDSFSMCILLTRTVKLLSLFLSLPNEPECILIWFEIVFIRKRQRWFYHVLTFTVFLPERSKALYTNNKTLDSMVFYFINFFFFHDLILTQCSVMCWIKRITNWRYFHSCK